MVVLKLVKYLSIGFNVHIQSKLLKHMVIASMMDEDVSVGGSHLHHLEGRKCFI